MNRNWSFLSDKHQPTGKPSPNSSTTSTEMSEKSYSHWSHELHPRKQLYWVHRTSSFPFEVEFEELIQNPGLPGHHSFLAEPGPVIV